MTGSIENSDTGEKLAITNLVVTTTGDGEDGQLWNVGTTEETHTIVVTNPGAYILINEDGTNFVQIGFNSTTNYEHRLAAGRFMTGYFDPGVATVYAKFDTAAGNLRLKIFEA